MARQYSLLDGSLLSDDSSAEFTTLGGAILSGTGDAGTIINWVQVGDSIAAVTDGDVILTGTLTQSGDNLQAQILMAGYALPAFSYALADVIVVDDGQRTFAGLNGTIIAVTDNTIADHIAAVSYSQDANSVASEVTIGATTAANCSVAWTQAANTLSSTVGPLADNSISFTQAGNTLVSAAEVKRILLVATGTVEIGAVSSITQAGNTVVAFLNTGANNVNIAQASNAITAEVISLVDIVAAANAYAQTIASDAYVLIPTSRWVTLNFRRADGTLPAMTTFKWAFWDDPTPDLLDTATARGTGTIRADGTCTLVFDGSTLNAGEIGYLTMSDTDGDPDVQWRHHSGPVRVS